MVLKNRGTSRKRRRWLESPTNCALVRRTEIVSPAASQTLAERTALGLVSRVPPTISRRREDRELARSKRRF
jgi:hypothetical protein